MKKLLFLKRFRVIMHLCVKSFQNIFKKSMNYKWCVSGAVHTGQGERNMDYIARENALALLKRYNQDPFHLQHAFTVEAVMKWYANELGYAEDAEYWGIVGLLHDIDFE